MTSGQFRGNTGARAKGDQKTRVTDGDRTRGDWSHNPAPLPHCLKRKCGNLACNCDCSLCLRKADSVPKTPQKPPKKTKPRQDTGAVHRKEPEPPVYLYRASDASGAHWFATDSVEHSVGTLDSLGWLEPPYTVYRYELQRTVRFEFGKAPSSPPPPPKERSRGK